MTKLSPLSSYNSYLDITIYIKGDTIYKVVLMCFFLKMLVKIDKIILVLSLLYLFYFKMVYG